MNKIKVIRPTNYKRTLKYHIMDTSQENGNRSSELKYFSVKVDVEFSLQLTYNKKVSHQHKLPQSIAFHSIL